MDITREVTTSSSTHRVRESVLHLSRSVLLDAAGDSRLVNRVGCVRSVGHGDSVGVVIR